MKINEVILNEGLWSNLKYAAGRVGDAVSGSVGGGNNAQARSMISKYEQIAKNGWLKRIRPFEIMAKKQAQMQQKGQQQTQQQTTQQTPQAQDWSKYDTPTVTRRANASRGTTGTITEAVQSAIENMPRIIYDIMLNDFHMSQETLAQPEFKQTLDIIAKQAADAYSKNDNGTLRQLFREMGEMAFQVASSAYRPTSNGGTMVQRQQANRTATTDTVSVSQLEKDPKKMADLVAKVMNDTAGYNQQKVVDAINKSLNDAGFKITQK